MSFVTRNQTAQHGLENLECYNPKHVKAKHLVFGMDYNAKASKDGEMKVTSC